MFLMTDHNPEFTGDVPTKAYDRDESSMQYCEKLRCTIECF